MGGGIFMHFLHFHFCIHTQSLSILCLFLLSLSNFLVMFCVSFPQTRLFHVCSRRRLSRNDSDPQNSKLGRDRFPKNGGRKPIFVLFFLSFAVRTSLCLLRSFFHMDPGPRDVLSPPKRRLLKASSACRIYRVPL